MSQDTKQTTACTSPGCDAHGAALCEAHCPHFDHVVRDKDAEIERLRDLVSRLTDAAENLAREVPDPGTEALAAIHCGRNFIYG